MKTGHRRGRRRGDPPTFAQNRWRSPCRRATRQGITGLDRPHQAGRQGRPVRSAGAVRRRRQKVVRRRQLTVTPVTLEQDVKAVLTKVKLGEVDAGARLQDRRDGGR